MRKYIRKVLLGEQTSRPSALFRKCLNYFPLNNRIIRRRDNNLHIQGILLKSKICFAGKGNTIIIGNRSVLINCNFTIKGNNNIIEVGDNCGIRCCEFFIEDDGGRIRISENTGISGWTHLACIEGKEISIGNNCLFSSNIQVRVGDSHTIIGADGERINPSKNIIIHDHVWIGNQVIILKGSEIEQNSIVATGAIVTGRFKQKGIIIGGNPSRIIKEGISWDEKRFKL